ncbi:MAG: hypothetical protein M1838_003505 [Thelocarpon superellum]|nr:MAG: hypothetical protein M1838_003505 [Thelocarpon superellum]
MAVAGQRFELDVSSDASEDVHLDRSTSMLGVAPNLLADVKEHVPAALTMPPSAPSQKHAGTGFPAHRKRTTTSKFKQQRASEAPSKDSSMLGRDDSSAAVQDPKLEAAGGNEQMQIDEENRQKIASMSEEEIQRERADLLAGLTPSLVERLLRRSTIDDPTDASTMGTPADSPDADVSSSRRPTQGRTHPEQSPRHQDQDPDAEPTFPPADLTPASGGKPPPQPTIHFPRPPKPPELDPSSPSFLEALHENYFPNLSPDPSRLAWMAPLPTDSSPADQTSPYSPTQDSLAPSTLRFDFRGALLAPRTARAVPVTKGLHHHGEAPEAAGYTIPELSRLARSAFAAQRCMAFQTLGRLLYRLGKGYLGDEGSDLVMGLWRCVEEGRIVEVLQAEATREDGQGHLSAKTYATEAVWNWQRGGGKRWKAK